MGEESAGLLSLQRRFVLSRALGDDLKQSSSHRWSRVPCACPHLLPSAQPTPGGITVGPSVSLSSFAAQFPSAEFHPCCFAARGTLPVVFTTVQTSFGSKPWHEVLEGESTTVVIVNLLPGQENLPPCTAFRHH